MRYHGGGVGHIDPAQRAYPTGYDTPISDSSDDEGASEDEIQFTVADNGRNRTYSERHAILTYTKGDSNLDDNPEVEEDDDEFGEEAIDEQFGVGDTDSTGTDVGRDSGSDSNEGEEYAVGDDDDEDIIDYIDDYVEE